jgi:hypothetical protein
MTVYARLIDRHQNMMNTITFFWSPVFAFLRFLRFPHKRRSENSTEIYKPAHHRGCASPFGSRHTNPGRAEQGFTGLMVSALFITIYVGLGAQPVGLLLGRFKTTAQKWLVCGLVT